MPADTTGLWRKSTMTTQETPQAPRCHHTLLCYLRSHRHWAPPGVGRNRWGRRERCDTPEQRMGTFTDDDVSWDARTMPIAANPRPEPVINISKAMLVLDQLDVRSRRHWGALPGFAKIGMQYYDYEKYGDRRSGGRSADLFPVLSGRLRLPPLKSEEDRPVKVRTANGRTGKICSFMTDALPPEASGTQMRKWADFGIHQRASR